MFSKIIADEQKKRDEALEQISQEMQGLARVFPFNAVTEAVQNSPWQTCAISLGAGLAASSLIPAKTKTVAAPAQPQRVVIDLRNVGASAETPPPPQALIHGHCHTSAGDYWGSPPAKRARATRRERIAFDQWGSAVRFLGTDA